MPRGGQGASVPVADTGELGSVLAEALAGDDGPLRRFLRGHSHLPGPRGNLELAGRFAAAVASLVGGPGADAAWAVTGALAAVGPDVAPTGDPGEFLAFCGTLAGSGFVADPVRRPAAWARIEAAAGDPRWRMREAAAQAIQRAIPLDPAGSLARLEAWAAEGPWLLCRAVVAGVADPPLLADPGLAARALRLHEVVIGRFAAAAGRGDPDLRILRRGLGYSLSVVVSALPGAGFALLDRLAREPVPDVAWVLRSNLGKSRLTRRHPAEAAALLRRLEG